MEWLIGAWVIAWFISRDIDPTWLLFGLGAALLFGHCSA